MLKIGEIYFTESDEGEIKLNQNFLGLNETAQVDALQDLLVRIAEHHSEACDRWGKEMERLREEGGEIYSQTYR